MLALWWSGVMEGKAEALTGVAEPWLRKGSRAEAGSHVRWLGRRLEVLEAARLEDDVEEEVSRWWPSLPSPPAAEEEVEDEPFVAFSSFTSTGTEILLGDALWGHGGRKALVRGDEGEKKKRLFSQNVC